jgi:hypothetical protein
MASCGALVERELPRTTALGRPPQRQVAGHLFQVLLVFNEAQQKLFVRSVDGLRSLFCPLLGKLIA